MPQATALLDDTRAPSCDDAQIDYTLTTDIPFGYDFHWLREPARGVFSGTVPVRINADSPAQLAVSIRCWAEQRLALDRDGRYRLRLLAKSRPEVAVEASTRQAGARELLAALLGLHPLQWLRQNLKDVGSCDWKRVAELHGASTSNLEQLHEFWRCLTASTEAALWSALASSDTLVRFQLWLGVLNGLDSNADAFDEAVSLARADNPHFAETAAGQWVQAAGRRAAGAGLAQMIEISHHAENTLSNPELRTLLLRLRATAVRNLDPNLWGDWSLLRASEILGPMPDRGTLHSRLEPWRELCARIQDAAAPAIENRLGLRLASPAGVETTPLLHMTFDDRRSAILCLERLSKGDLPTALRPGKGARLHDSVLTSLLFEPVFVDVRMPFFDKHDCRRMTAMIAGARADLGAPGEILLRVETHRPRIEPRIADVCVEVFASALSRVSEEPMPDLQPVGARFEFDLTPGLVAKPWEQVLEHHGIHAPSEALASAQARSIEARACFDLSISSCALEAWTRTPHGRDATFTDTFSRVAEVVQKFNRAWLPAVFFSNPAQFGDNLATWSFLAFAATPVYRGRYRGDFTWEAMNRSSVEAALARSAENFCPLVESMRPAFEDAGLSENALKPKRVKRLINRLGLQNKIYRSLLVFDAFVVEDVIRIAESVRDIRSRLRYDAASIARRLKCEAPAFARAAQTRLRRISDAPEFSNLIPLLLIEVTSALAGVESEASFSVESGGRLTSWPSRNVRP